MTGNEEATVLDLEEIVDGSLRKIEQLRLEKDLLRLDNALLQLDQLEQELEEFLRIHEG